MLPWVTQIFPWAMQAVAADGIGKGHEHAAVDRAVLLAVAVADHHNALGPVLLRADEVDAVFHGPGSRPRISPNWGSCLKYSHPSFLSSSEEAT